MSRSQSTRRLPTIRKKTLPETVQKREADFYRQMKDGITKLPRKVILTRIETWASAGVPDLMICDEEGHFHFIELKNTSTNAVELRPHQVAWACRHGHASSWILVRKQTSAKADQELYLFNGHHAVELRMEGLQAVEPVCHQVKKFDWSEVLDLITRR